MQSKDLCLVKFCWGPHKNLNYEIPCFWRFKSDFIYSHFQACKGESGYVWKAHSKHSSQAKQNKQRCFDKLTHLHTHGVRVRHKQHLWFYLFCLGENKKEEPNYLWTLGQAQNQTLFHWGQNEGGDWESGIGISEDSASAGSKGLLERKRRAGRDRKTDT